MIDFGSSGLVKKGGWDTFSGTQVIFGRVEYPSDEGPT